MGAISSSGASDEYLVIRKRRGHFFDQKTLIKHGVVKMGANRAQRRQQERDQMREWKQKGTYDRMMSIRKNGITEKDLQHMYQDGYKEGYMYSAEKFFRKMYAAMAKELIEAGNTKDDVIDYKEPHQKEVDRRFAVMFDAEDEIDSVYDLIGVRFDVSRNALERVEEI